MLGRAVVWSSLRQGVSVVRSGVVMWKLGNLRESYCLRKALRVGAEVDSWEAVRSLGDLFSTAAGGVDNLESFTTLWCLGKEGGERKWVWK